MRPLAELRGPATCGRTLGQKIATPTPGFRVQPRRFVGIDLGK